MRKDFWKILETLNKAKTVITLNTNATLITRPIAKKLSRFPIRPYTVSLDGSLPEIHDSLRGRGAFEKTIKGIKNLVSQKLPVLISTTVTRLNYKDLYDIALLGKKLGVSKVRFNEVLCVGNAACFPRDLMLTADEKAGLLEIAEEIRNRFGKFATGTIFAGLEFIKKIKQMPRENFPLKARPCAAATTICDIRPDGWVTPCGILWDVKAGNLKNESLYNIWHNSPVMKAFRKTIELKKEDAPECEGCKYLAACYKGHRCYPYYIPMPGIICKKLYYRNRLWTNRSRSQA